MEQVAEPTLSTPELGLIASTRHAPVYKVLIAGDGSVGKSSLVQRHLTGRLIKARVMTVGVDFHTQTVKLGEREVRLSIWDIGGQKRFACLRRSFYRGARAAALVFDVSNADTLHALPMWRDEILKIAPKARILIVGNKVDRPRAVSNLVGKAWATAMGYPYLEASALSGQGVDRVFEGLGWLAATR
jgi:small GTP-binding protein